MPLNLHIVTPSRNMLSMACDDVVLPGYDGEMGILSEHTQLVNRLGAGIIKIKNGAETKTLAIAGGVAEIINNEVTVLADDAVFPQEVNLQKLEQDQKIISEQLVTLAESTTDRERLFEKQRWITAQKELAQS